MGCKMKGRRHLHLPLDILEDMANSGIDISEWASNAWLDSKYSIKSVENEIKQLEERLTILKSNLKRNKKFMEEMNTLKDSKEIKLLAQLDQQLKKCSMDMGKEEEQYIYWKNKYKHYLNKNLTTNMVKHRLELYRGQFK